MESGNIGQTSVSNEVNAKIDEVAGMAQSAVGQLSRQAQDLTSQASDKINNVSSQIKDTTQNLTRGVDQAVRSVDKVSMYVKDFKDKDPQARIHIVEDTVRTYPLPCLLGGAILGFFMGRLIR